MNQVETSKKYMSWYHTNQEIQEHETLAKWLAIGFLVILFVSILWS